MGFAHKLLQEVTHWPITGSDGFGGFVFGAPVLLEGRWEEKSELFISEDNESVLSKAIVYLDSDVDNGDYVAQGDHTAVADPLTVVSYRIRNYGKVTDLRNLIALRKLWL